MRILTPADLILPATQDLVAGWCGPVSMLDSGEYADGATFGDFDSEPTDRLDTCRPEVQALLARRLDSHVAADILRDAIMGTIPPIAAAAWLWCAWLRRENGLSDLLPIQVTLWRTAALAAGHPVLDAETLYLPLPGDVVGRIRVTP